MSNKRSNEMQTVIDFCLEHAEEAPLSKRISLYLGLAEFCGEPQEAADFRGVAKRLKDAHDCCRQLAFQMKGDR